MIKTSKFSIRYGKDFDLVNKIEDFILSKSDKKISRRAIFREFSIGKDDLGRIEIFLIMKGISKKAMEPKRRSGIVSKRILYTY